MKKLCYRIHCHKKEDVAVLWHLTLRCSRRAPAVNCLITFLYSSNRISKAGLLGLRRLMSS